MEKFKIVGEFEPQESVLLIWPMNEWATVSLNVDEVSTKIVNALVTEVHVIICCYDNSVLMRSRKKLENKNVNLSNVEFVIYPSEIPYPRDFGAEVLIGDKSSLKRIDFRFNMYGYNDENDELSIKLKHFSKFHADLIGEMQTSYADIISEGGDREFNSKGVMMSIKDTEVNKRNPDKTLDEVESIFKKIFGVDKIIWLPKGTYDDEYAFSGPIPNEDGEFNAYRSASANGHVDEMCRFVDEETILIAHITEDEAKTNKLSALNKQRLDAALEVVSNATDCNNKPFNILKMPVPEAIYIDLTPQDNAYELWSEAEELLDGKLEDGSPFPKGNIKVLPALSYCNFLICNNIVLAQCYYEPGMPLSIKKKDEQSLEVLRKAFPNRQVIQINTLALNLYGGGIHCNTRNIPKIKSV